MKIIGVFFVFSVVCLSFIMVNLFIGVLCFHFGEAKNSMIKGALILTKDQQIWIELQNSIVKAKAKKIKKKKHNFTPKRKIDLKKFLNSKGFDIFIMTCILFNIAVMCMNYEGSPPFYDDILNYLNYGFTGVFFIECCLKLFEFGFFEYFKNSWNKLDLVIVVLSLIDILFTFSGGSSNKMLRIGPQIIRIFRIIRVIRMIKLLRQLQGLKKLMQNFIISLPNIFSIFLLLLLFFFIFSILGVFLFQNITTGNSISNTNNFSDFLSAFFLLLGMISGGSWSTIMFDCFNLSSDCIPGSTCGTSKFYNNSL